MKTAKHDVLLGKLEERFEKHAPRHVGIEWSAVRKRLDSKPGKLEALEGMEVSGGEPDVFGYDEKTEEFIFCDCSPESPAGRRSLCYDRAALEARKEHKPAGDAIEIAAAMGVELLTEEQYRDLQKLGEFDRKTSSWIRTPDAVRQLGGALFCERRYGLVFVFHNGADSYYAVRGFRGSLRV